MRPSQRWPMLASIRPHSASVLYGLSTYRVRLIVDSGAPASTRSAATRSVRGVAFGWANVCVSWDDAGQQDGGQLLVDVHAQLG